ncbi:MAG: vWA domain-containing protein, partial [Limisphaerales bacterium]
MSANPKEQYKRIQKAASVMLLDEPFYALLLLRLQIQPDPAIPTFCTDGRTIRFNADWCATLTEKQIVTVLGEEIIHNAAGHLFRAPAGADWKTWNLACDQEARWVMQGVNETLAANNLGPRFPWPKPEDAPKPEHRGHAAEFVYAAMMRKKAEKGGHEDTEKQSGQNQGPGQGQPSPSSAPPSPSSQPNSTPGTTQSQSGSGQGNGHPSPSSVPPSLSGQPVPSSNPKSAIPNPNSLGEIVEPGGSPSDQVQLKAEWEVAVTQAAAIAKGRGNAGAFADRLVREIVMPRTDPLKPLTEWLTETARDDYDWMRPNPHYLDTGFILPSLHSKSAGTIILARDTSGSIDARLLARMKGILQWVLDELRPERLVVVDCDYSVTQVQEFTPGDDYLIQTEIAKGGGGTRFTPVF